LCRRVLFLRPQTVQAKLVEELANERMGE